MPMEWIKELGFGLLWLFAQPIFYLAILFTFWTGYQRIKKDRKMFRHRVFPIGSEWNRTWLLGISFGIILSTSMIVSGSMFTIEWLWFWTAVVTISLLVHQVWLLSPVYTVGVVAIIMWLIEQFNVQLPSLIEPAFQVDIVLVSYLLIALFLVEILLISTSKRDQSFPELQKGNRGKYIGRHLVKRLLLVPAFIPVPSGALELSVFDWWPAFGLGDQFGLVLFPFLIGYSQRFQGQFTDVGTRKTAIALTGLFIVLLASAYVVYLYEEMSIYLIGLAMIGRATVHYLLRFIDREKSTIFTPKQNGIIIVGVIPGSPADEMGLVVGEVIEKIHDQSVTNEQEFYEVMSDHRTFCKMAVRDLTGEVRFVQRALYEGEYHELGLIFVKETPRFTLKNEEIS
ncbi:PDZ domain-containing protein [Piscibacillus halophilus]|uniref:PDZ domain-containing protein n=1 Tax=Piscibacillus halophilus TaxID=571933 RepID=A0A1H9EFS1_9BACI|nr:PDZ domain-containing protein [Piscibacillus halophilus]SEQ24521.1 hypothetical protein SAMN05216362_10952 [Piscibacillus halophilus]